MDESELDRFLRGYTKFESALRGSSNSADILIDNDELFAKDSKWQAFPDTRKFYVQLLSRSQESNSFTDDTFIPPGQSITFLMRPRHAEPVRHRHSFVEMICVYSGRCNQTIGNTLVNMVQGELCILDTRTYHCIESAGDNDIIINCLMKKSFFDAAFLGRLSGNDVFSQFFVNAILIDDAI